jgi:hypothetical protein
VNFSSFEDRQIYSGDTGTSLAGIVALFAFAHNLTAQGHAISTKKSCNQGLFITIQLNVGPFPGR